MIYLDNAATTQVSEKVAEAMLKILTEDYGNPSAQYALGRRAKEAIEQARAVIAQGLGVRSEEICFTSCGTEANNLAVLGAKTGNVHEKFLRYILEHSSVVKAHERLAKERETETFGAVDGMVDKEELLSKVDDRTRLVSLMHVQNELGNIQDIYEIGEAIKEKNPKTLFHVDGIQAFGKIPVDLSRAPIDLYSISGHKFHGPKGVGALYIKKGVHLSPVILGGGQERGLSSGTENVAGIVGMGVAASEALAHSEVRAEKVGALKKTLTASLLSMEDVLFLSAAAGSPYILSVAFADIRAEVLLRILEDQGICVSTGSACHRGKKSATVTHLNLPTRFQDGVVRISMTDTNTMEEIEFFTQVIKKAVPMIRKVVKRS